MHVLVLNAGSSSIKGAVLDAHSGARAASLRIERLGTDAAVARLDDAEIPIGAVGVAGALDRVLPAMRASVPTLAGVGHRVVHGGERFTAPTLIDDGVLQAIEDLTSLAPLHNPANAAGIRAARALLPGIPHVAVFDTAFHATLPRRARSYALPQDIVEAHGIRRYGFHGTSHAWCARQVADALEQDIRDLRIISCHLGNGASACAVEYGRSVETSMGMTPLEGLVMGTRSGDVDPGVLLMLMRDGGLDVDGLDELLNRRSGLAGLSGVGNDMRDIEARAAEGDEASRLALHVFTHRLRKQIGGYAAAMGGVDAIAFTGGIGENSALVRHRTLQRLDFLGARLDEDANRDAAVSPDSPISRIDERNSRVALVVVSCDEQREIARQTAALVAERDRVTNPRVIPIAVSARHIHLTRAAVDTLFGGGHTLTPYRPLSQPGQFACEEKLTIVGPKRRIESVRVLGPERRACQVEVSRTDEFFLGLDAPVRDSGDVANSTGCTLIGPAGQLTLKEGVICARRHIHMTPDDAEHFGVDDRDVVEVAVRSEDRDLTFGDVLIRVSPKYALEMHLDTDEANAAEISRGHTGALVGTGAEAQLVRRKIRFDRAK
jgi:acetate kinase